MGCSLSMDHPSALTSESRPQQDSRSPSPGQLAQTGGTIRPLFLLHDISVDSENFL